mmetsp:Transcript_99296/g.256767  ORF Transcript_99296/g.256767 Transcript_99296/m.256767 type:complete len:200 (+) Transcript_99296:79-678(+)
MAAMRLIVVACSLASFAAWEIPMPKKFQPLVDACEPLAPLSNCTAHMDGTCTTHEDGVRSCEHKCEHHGLWQAMRTIKDKLGFHGNGHHHSKTWPRLLGDCGGKADGETCTTAHEGQCVPSGKCPIFKGQLVCKPRDVRPPEFVTKPCDGKQEGEACKLTILSGTCTKGKYEDYMACKTWPFSSNKADGAAKDETVLVV